MSTMTPASALRGDEARTSASGMCSHVIAVVADASTVEIMTLGGDPYTDVTWSVSSNSMLAPGIAWTSSSALARVRLNR